MLKLLQPRMWVDIFDKTLWSLKIIKILFKVAISGLNSILPLIGNQLLEYPPLAESYYNLLNSLCEIYTDKVLILDSNLLSPLLHSLQLGLSQFGNEIAKTVLEAISALSACIYDQIKVSKHHNHCLKWSNILRLVEMCLITWWTQYCHLSVSYLILYWSMLPMSNSFQSALNLYFI